VGGRYLARRLFQAGVTILLIVAFNFVLFRMMPGSPERVLLRNPHLSAATVASVRERWGLDRPVFPDQFVSYFQSTFQGDLGYSFRFRGVPVTDVLGERIWPTLILFGLGQLIAVIAGLILGAYSGWRRGRALDYVGNGVSLILYSTPYFIVGMLLLVVFASMLGWFPVAGMFTVGGGSPDNVARLLDFLRHLALPLITVSIGLIGEYAILMRSSIIETLDEDYVTTARAKGLTDGRVLRAHAVPNAMLPTVSLVAIGFGYVIAGAITVEVVFNWPGLGTLTVEALSARDYPILQGIFLLLSITVVLANVLADLVYGFLDPRVRT
jgi:peptide/nickel transport system permease protein